MRIFLSCQQALVRHNAPAYSFWEGYFKHGLEEGRHTWLEAPGVDWAKGLTALTPEARAGWLEETWSRTVAFLRTEHARQPVDFFLSYLFPDQVEPAAVQQIRELGIPCVNFFCDNVREFTRVPKSYQPFDLHWVPEAEALAMYDAAHLKFIHAPMPTWVPPAFRQPAEQENETVIFIGSHDALREELLAEVVERGLRVQVHGSGWSERDALPGPSPQAWPRRLSNQMNFWRRHGLRGYAMQASYRWRKRRPTAWMQELCAPSLMGNDYFRATRESLVTIGINRYPSVRHSFRRPHSYSRLRDIEAPMLGACYLTEQAPGLDQLYELGTEIETYRDAAELVEKTNQLRRDPARRQLLRRQGQRRALGTHSISRSLERIQRELGLAGKNGRRS